MYAIDLPGGSEFVTALRQVWDAGHAASPLEQRLPAGRRAELLATIGPDAIIDASVVGDVNDIGLSAAVAYTGPRTGVAGDGELRSGDALVVATSGTTGQPKGVILTHDAVAASARATSERLDVDATSRWLACLPLSHVGGLAVVCRALVVGTDLVVHARFDAAAAMASGATHVSLVRAALTEVDPAAFHRILLGGSAPPDELPPNVTVTYGSTETGSGVVYDGRPLTGTEIDIAADGTIRLAGPTLLRCYRDGTTPLRDGWLSTGDLGRWSDDGQLEVLGRADDLIVTGGENVWPDAVERLLATHPLVAEVAVTGTADDRWGQIVTAHVVPRDANDPPTLDDFRRHVDGVLADYCAPRRLHLVASIPRTSSGKPRRRELAG